MTKRQLIIAGGVVVLIVLGAVGWWLASPLFRNDVVDEAFPFAVPGAEEVAAMSMDERMALEQAFETAVPAATTIEELSREDQAKLEEMVQEAASVVMMDKEMAEPMPAAPAEWAVVKAGNFVDADSFHKGSGAAAIYQQGEQQVLRFEDFNVTNGPDLHVILTKHSSPVTSDDVGDDTIDLGSIKGNQGNQNYDIPSGVDLSEYQSVVIYCVPFQVVFAVAALNEAISTK
jgi:hypothetical protein